MGQSDHMTTIKRDHTVEILSEMFRRVGAEYSPEAVREPQWFMDHQWPSHEAEREFTEWLAGYLKKHRIVAGRYLHEASKLACDYGWKSMEGYCEYVRGFKEGATRYVRKAKSPKS